jgi:hypothetical protein
MQARENGCFLESRIYSPGILLWTTEALEIPSHVTVQVGVVLVAGRENSYLRVLAGIVDGVGSIVVARNDEPGDSETEQAED